MELEKKKRGRKPKANPQLYRYCFRMNKADYERFLQMYKRSGMQTYSAFIADCVLNHKPKIIKINKSAIDFVMLLSSFFAQFRAIGVNYNQVLKHIKTTFPGKKGLAMMYRLENATKELVISNQKIIKLVAKLKTEFLKQ